MILSTKNYKRAYIWELPVRIFHWLNAFAITFLVITGVIIASPPAIMSAREASESFWFGDVRLIHFMCAYIVVACMVLRIYWAFAGNRFANWRTLIPSDKGWPLRIWHVIKYDILLQNEKEYNFKNISIGHNDLAGFSYLIMFILALIMIGTGFAMYAPMSTWFLPKMFGWIGGLFFDGDEQKMRMVHHFTMWIFIAFVIIHIYLVFFHDWLEGRGETSSMISGHKFVRTELVKDFAEEPDEAEKRDLE